ncbi:MAG TPA: bacterial proteasome activator family protein [Intrasporangiaceae bacterium]|nr:bacterial proteasome activator family protein [Intrasporangiaceae bacterium]
MGVADARTPADEGRSGGAGEGGAADSAGEDGDSAEDSSAQRRPTDLVEQPAKVMRIGSMVKSLLEEVRGAPLDDAGRAHLAQIHARSIAELKDGLAPELVDELDRIALPFSDDNPTDAELRIAQAQLVGWLEGLFHGIQTALVAQQMAAQAQLQQMRQLPPGLQTGSRPAEPRQGQQGTPPHEGTGQYL